MELIVGILGLILTGLGVLLAHAVLNDEQRKRFNGAALRTVEFLFVTFFTGYAIYVIFSFLSQSTPPTRVEIGVLLIHSFNLIALPKSLIDGYYQRRANERQKELTAAWQRLTASLQAHSPERPPASPA